MSENIVEITRKIQDKTAIQKDLSDAMELVTNMFRERYFDKLSTVVTTHQVSVKNNPPKEVQLLNVLKQFSPDTHTENFDRMIDMMLLMNTITNMRTELTQQQAPTPQPVRVASSSIHEDGIYDVDQSCLTKPKKQPDLLSMFMVMSMALKR